MNGLMYVLMIDPESVDNSDTGLGMEDVALRGVFETEGQAVRAVGKRLSDLRPYIGVDRAWGLTYHPDGEDEAPEDLLLREVPIGKLLD